MPSPRLLADDAMAIVRAGLAAVDAGRLVREALVAAPPEGRIVVVAAGKAAGPMAVAAQAVLGRSIRSGMVVTTVPVDLGEPFVTFVGGHPVPTAESVKAGRHALSLAESLSPDETLLVLLSGGASALLALPADGVSLDDKRETTNRLLLAGADISALNIVRKHLSLVKGGQLAAAAKGRCRALVISDVVGDDLSAIASGPTVGDASTFGDALEILERFGGRLAFPQSVVARLEAGTRGEVADTPGPGDPRLSRALTTVIGGRVDAMDGAAREAGSRGYHVVRLDEAIVGEARVAAAAYVRDVATRTETLDRPICVVSSGETTVRVTGHGRGGRNQEFALAASAALPSMGAPVLLASVGTDGVDGPTDAAGALVDETTCARAAARGLGAPQSYLDDNDSYAFFYALDDLVRTGPTGTNVGDLQVMLLGRPR